MTDMIDAIADKLVEDHVELMNENKRLRDALEKCADMVESMGEMVVARTAATAIRALLHKEFNK